MEQSVGGFFSIWCYTMKKKHKGQGILRVSIENGVIRTQLLTPKEEQQFLRTHPNFKSQTLSVEDIERLARTVGTPAEPSTVSVANGL
jgi:hypothetical protein